MKSLLTVIIFTSSLMLVSFTANETKLISASYTVQDWQNKLNLIEYTKAVLKNSDVPTKIALPLVDSLSKFQNDLIQQLQTQIKDTTKKK